METNSPLAMVNDSYDDFRIGSALAERLNNRRVTSYRTANDFLIAVDAFGVPYYSGLIIDPLTPVHDTRVCHFHTLHPDITNVLQESIAESYRASIGLEVVRKMRAKQPQLPIVVLTSLAPQNDIFFPDAENRYLSAGATAFHTKPTSIDDLAGYFRV